MAPTFTALEIANDAHELVLRYRPTYLRPSMTVSLAAAMLIVGMLLAQAVTHRRSQKAARG